MPRTATATSRRPWPRPSSASPLPAPPAWDRGLVRRPGIGLYDRRLAIARIEAAVEAATALDHPFVITGRTEVLLYGLDGGMGEALARLQGFASVGAHCLYAPGTGT